jgi:predicted exporter
MTAIANVLSRTLHIASEIDALEQIAIFCAVGLVASLIVINCGVDLSTGFVGP